jgi:hypothetical protein
MMDCAQVTAYLDPAAAAPRSAPPPEVRNHLEQCPKCRALWNFAREPETLTVDPATEERIQCRLLAALRPVRPLPSRSVLTGGFVAIFVAVSALTLLAVGSGDRPAITLSQLFGLIAAVVLTAGAAGFWLSGAMTPGEKRWTGSTALCAGALLALGLVVALLFPWEMPNNLLAGSLKCFRAGLLFSIPAIAPLALLISRGCALSMRAVGAVAGLLAGLVGFLVLHIECSLYAAPHIAVAHLTGPLAGAAAGYGFGFLLEKVRGMRPVSV